MPEPEHVPVGEIRLLALQRGKYCGLVEVRVIEHQTRFGRLEHRVKPMHGHGAYVVDRRGLMTRAEAEKRYPHLIGKSAAEMGGGS